MENKTCPICGFIAHPLCSIDGQYWKYTCERCGRVFLVKIWLEDLWWNISLAEIKSGTFYFLKSKCPVTGLRVPPVAISSECVYWAIQHIAPSAAVQCAENKALIVLSSDAFRTIQEEINTYPTVETGGILLGMKIGFLWYVSRILSSTSDCKRTPCHFSMDPSELAPQVHTYLCMNQWHKVLGIWHKHNHNYAPFFSYADDQTNFAYAKLNAFGAISILATKETSHYLLRGFYVNRKNGYQSKHLLGKRSISF